MRQGPEEGESGGSGVATRGVQQFGRRSGPYGKCARTALDMQKPAAASGSIPRVIVNVKLVSQQPCWRLPSLPSLFD